MYNHRKRPEENPNTLTMKGAVGGVTGSCTKVETGTSKIFVDFGLFQGKHEERSGRGERHNFAQLPKDTNQITDVLGTHAHIDHIGNIPRLFKLGLSPRILVTRATAELMDVMLHNSADIQEKEHPDNQLYGNRDVDKAMRKVQIVSPYDEVEIGPRHSGDTATFLPNGHIVGSNAIEIKTKKNGQEQTILFTGDMGKPNQSLCGGYKDFVGSYPKDPISVIVAETTNISKEPVTFEEKRNSLISSIKNIWQRGGNVLLPVLSNHRMQETIEMLNNCRGTLLPKDYKLVVDAPLGVKVSKVMEQLVPDNISCGYGDDHFFYKSNEESANRFKIGSDQLIETHEESVQNVIDMAEYPGKAIIIASGGMGEKGRCVSYLHGEFGKNPKNGVLFTCHQVEGTNGASLVRNKTVKGGATTELIDGFTSHASGPDQSFGYMESFNLEKLETVVLNHGNEAARQAMENEFILRAYVAKIVKPKLNDVIKI